jgi:hypothetical protein
VKQVGKPVSLKFTNFDSHLWNRHPACLKKKHRHPACLKKTQASCLFKKKQRHPACLKKNTGILPVKKNRDILPVKKKHRQDACSTVAINHAKLI